MLKNVMFLQCAVKFKNNSPMLSFFFKEKTVEVPPPDVSSDQPTFSDILTVPDTGPTNAESKDAKDDSKVSEGKNSNRHEN